MNSAAPRALVAGLGLIGGSIGMALRARGWRVSYQDPAVEAGEAIRRGAADARVDDVRDTDIVILATPVDAAVEMMKRMPSIATTSVCSVMAPLRTMAEMRQLPFVAGHPLAGSHEHGLAAARDDLFEGKPWFIDRGDALVSRLIADCGAKEERADAAEHDRAVALTSHLPQLLSTALGALIDEKGDLRFAGSGLSTFMRLAGSDASVWSPVFEANGTNVAGALDEVLRIARAILDGDTAAFTKAQRALSKVSSARS